MQAGISGAEAATAGAAGSGTSWTSWAAAGLSTLGLLGGSAATNGTGQRASNSGSLGGAGRSSDTCPGLNSPLLQDWHQRSLVQQAAWQQHEAVHKQHLQEQHHSRQDAAVHSQHLSVSTLQYKQLLPAAVSSFQQHKLLKADSLWGNGIRSSQAGQQPGLSEPWSPTWLVRSFMPFGSPASLGPLSTADSPSTQQQQRHSSWSLLDACRVGGPPSHRRRLLAVLAGLQALSLCSRADRCWPCEMLTCWGFLTRALPLPCGFGLPSTGSSSAARVIDGL